jgi:hypothetical protein
MFKKSSHYRLNKLISQTRVYRKSHRNVRVFGPFGFAGRRTRLTLMLTGPEKAPEIAKQEEAPRPTHRKAPHVP